MAASPGLPVKSQTVARSFSLDRRNPVGSRRHQSRARRKDSP